MAQYTRVDPKYVFAAKGESHGFGLDQPSRVTYFPSHRIDQTFRLKVEGLTGVEGEMAQDVYAQCELFYHGQPLCAPAVTPHCSFHSQLKWTSWLYFPILYRDLPLDTLIGVTVFSPSLPPPHILGGTTFYLFTSKGQLKRGLRKYLLHPGVAADGSERLSTSGHIPDKDFMTRLNKDLQEYVLQQPLHIPWLDKLTFTEVNKLNKKHMEASGARYLTVEFPSFPHPVVFALSPAEAQGLLEYAARDDFSPLALPRDPELNYDNPAENKHLKLAKYYHLFVDPDLVPSARDRRRIAEITSRPPLQELESEEKVLLWQFRYFLTKERKGFVKFMKSVDWNSKKESNEALRVAQKWENISTVDGLELLSATFAGAKEPRRFGLQALKATSDEELVSILLQVVQALRYEAVMKDSELAEFLLARALRSWEIANNLHWYLVVEREDDRLSGTFAALHEAFLGQLEVRRPEFRRRLRRQHELIKGLTDLYNDVRQAEKDRKKKIALLNRKMQEGQYIGNLFNTHRNEETGVVTQDTIFLPTDANVEVKGIDPTNGYIFASALQPMRITFTTVNDKPTSLLFKHGDDLRQDQLVIQLINLMDSLLKKNGLDLKLTPYRVLATSVNGGLVECVPHCDAMAVHKKSVQRFLREKNPSPNDPHGIKPEALSNYIESCAGYCVITFLLGIGDRHLDNLMLTYDGRVFHIDFGYILGRDPKPFPPAMKITKEMVGGMGSEQEYHEFKSLCCSAYNILRKHASLILNLLTLMTDAKIPDISGKEGKMDPKMNIMKAQEKFRLDLNESEAIQYMQTVIHDSVSSAAGRIIDFFHELANPT
eukprot:EG_transcript_2562